MSTISRVSPLEVRTYTTDGGKDLILEFLDSLPKEESSEGYFIIKELQEQGTGYLAYLNTRQLQGKLWEIKFQRHNRIFYVLYERDIIYLLHACKKQKDKAEKFELKKAVQRMKEIN